MTELTAEIVGRKYCVEVTYEQFLAVEEFEKLHLLDDSHPSIMELITQYGAYDVEYNGHYGPSYVEYNGLFGPSYFFTLDYYNDIHLPTILKIIEQRIAQATGLNTLS